MISTQQATQNLQDYTNALNQSGANIQELQSGVGDLHDKLDIIDTAVSKIKALQSQMNEFRSDISDIKIVLRIMDKAGPLKIPAKVGYTIVNKVDSVVKVLDKKIDAIVDSIKKSSVAKGVEKAQDKLDALEKKLAGIGAEIDNHGEVFAQIANGAKTAGEFSEAPTIGAGTLVQPPLMLVGEINQAYEEIKDLVDAIAGSVPSGDFSAIDSVQRAFNNVAKTMADIANPLEKVANLLRPIEGLLDAVDFIASFTINPVINTILKVVGIEGVLNKAAAKISGQLPSTKALDKIEDAFDSVLDALDGLTNGDTIANIETWVEEFLVDKLMNVSIQTVDGAVQAQFGDAGPGVFGIGIEIPAPFRGSDDDNDLSAWINDVVLVGDDQDNTISTKGGTNLMIGGEGDDTLVGTEEGMDLAVFTGLRSQYDIAKSGNGTVTVTHKSPFKGAQSDGQDLLINVERAVFLDGIMAFDTEESAGSAYRIYQAAFARTPDNDGLKYWIDQIDEGLGLFNLASNFVQSAEFKSIYGADPTATEFIGRLYQNVLGREGEEGGMNYWVGQMESGARDAADILQNFSESAENVIGVAQAIEDGIFLS